MANDNEAQMQNPDAANSPYVDEKPTFWTSLSKTRKAAFLTGAAIAAGTSIFAVNLAIAAVDPNQPPEFGNGNEHKFPGLSPAGPPEFGEQPQDQTGTDPAAVPPIHGVPPMAIHPGDDTPTAVPLPSGADDGDGDDEGNRPPHGPREGDHHGHHGEDDNQSTEGVGDEGDDD